MKEGRKGTGNQSSANGALAVKGWNGEMERVAEPYVKGVVRLRMGRQVCVRQQNVRPCSTQSVKPNQMHGGSKRRTTAP